MKSFSIKEKACVAATFLFPAVLMAQDLKTALGVDNINTMIKEIVDILNGPIANVILMVVVVVIGYILMVNQDNQSVKKKAVAALIGLAIVRGAVGIAGWLTK